MRTIHHSRNLTIEFDDDRQLYLFTVRFGDESIAGRAEGHCPRCGSDSEVQLWELEGPGGQANTMWLCCAGDPPCRLDDKVLRWSADVLFERDWDDV
jgi:hypothetical protein